MKASVETASDDIFYGILDDAGVEIASTSISKGAKHTLGPGRVAAMANQLCLGKAGNLVDLVSCALGRDEALALMGANRPPGSEKVRR